MPARGACWVKRVGFMPEHYARWQSQSQLKSLLVGKHRRPISDAGGQTSDWGRLFALNVGRSKRPPARIAYSKRPNVKIPLQADVGKRLPAGSGVDLGEVWVSLSMTLAVVKPCWGCRGVMARWVECPRLELRYGSGLLGCWRGLARVGRAVSGQGMSGYPASTRINRAMPSKEKPLPARMGGGRRRQRRSDYLPAGVNRSEVSPTSSRPRVG